jgi:predicted MFS family arabinose efflux permease
VQDAQIRALPLALGGLVAMAAALGIGRFVYTPILPPMSEALALSKGEAGLLASANFIGYLAGALAAAMPWFKGRPRRALLGFLALSGVTTAAMAVPDRLPALMALRGVGGMASAYVLVLSSALVLERLARAGRSGLAPVHFAGVGVGITASALITWGLSTANFGWRAMWLMSGAVTLAAVAVAAVLIPESGTQKGVVSAAAATGGRADRRALAGLSLAYGLFGFGYIITITFIVVIVRGSAEARAYEPLFWLVIGLAATPSVAILGALARILGVTRAYALASLVLAAGVMASVASGSTWALLLSSALVGATFMGVTSLGIMGARAFGGADAGRWIAIATAGFGVGQIAGPIAAGYGYDMTGSFVLPSAMAAAALCAGAVLAYGLPNKT